MPTDFYDVLGAPADASSEELKRAYRSQVREYHPDVNDHPDCDAQFKLVRKANDVLSNPVERKDYDRMGHREYVDKRLEDLPPLSVLPELDDGESADSTSTTTDSSSSGSTDTNERGSDRGTDSRSRSTTTSTSASSSQSSGASQSTSAGTSGRTQSAAATQSSEGATSTERQQSTRSRRSTGSSRTASSSRSKNSSQSTSGHSTTSQTDTAGRANGGTSVGAERSAWDDVTERTARSTTAQSSRMSRRRRGLRRWYGVVLLSLLAYLGGLGTYAAPYAETLSGLLTGLTAAPVATLTSTFPLPSPTAYVLGTVDAAAAGEPGAGLLFLVGAVALPLVVLTAVAQFGQGSAWVYALASLGPVVPLAVTVVAPLTTALALGGLVVLPLFSGLGFLVDVGRYLYATR